VGYAVGQVIASIIDAFASANNALTRASNSASGATVSDGSSLSEWLGVLNAILPLQELVGWLTIIASLTVAIAIYRLIKSWIPTVSGG